MAGREAMRARVLCVPARDFRDLASWRGRFVAGCRPLLDALLRWPSEGGRAEFRPRGDVEEDPRWLQVVAYAVLRCPTEGRTLYAYRRPGTGDGEARLAGMWSVGVGGHVEIRDATPALPGARPRGLMEAVRLAAFREIGEECGTIPAMYDFRRVGCVHDDADAVGAVHLGVVYEAWLAQPFRGLTARGAADREDWRSPRAWLSEPPETWERWSRLILGEMTGPRPGGYHEEGRTGGATGLVRGRATGH
jgi:predicted NUDIX family phosphoesterase